MLKRFLPLLFAALATPLSAEAFCRSTTCRGSNCAVDERGCPKTGKPLYWTTGCLGYSLQKNLTQNLAQDDVRVAIQKAFQAWAQVDCGGGKFASLTFSPLADVSCNRSEYNEDGKNVNVVTFQDDDWKYKGTDNTLAKTTLTFDENTGEILDGDIEINSSANAISVGDQTTKYDLQSILTHEIGHFMGIAHSEYATATMFASYEPGSIDLRSLSADDIAAACAIYPPDRVTSCATTPHGGLGDTCSDTTGSGCTYARDTAVGPLTIGLVLSTLLSRVLRAKRKLCVL